MKITRKAVALLATFILVASASAEQPATERTQDFRAISKLINRPRSIWWDVFGTPWEGRGTDKGWGNGKQVNRKEPIYEVWAKGNGNETIGIGMTGYWNPSGME